MKNNKNKSQKVDKKLSPDSIKAMRMYNALVGNPGTGSGTNTDTSIQRVYRSEESGKFTDCAARLDELYNADAILQQIVQDPINDSLSGWRTTQTQLTKIEEELEYQRIFMEAGIFARRNGESLIIPILENNGNKVPLTTSLQKAIDDGSTVRRLMVISSFESDEKVVTDTFSIYHGRPIRYKIGEKGTNVHHSRVIPVYANLQRTSVFQGIEEYLAPFHLGRQDVSRAVQEANFLVLHSDFTELQKIVDNMNIVGGDDEDLYDFISNRLQNLRDNANNNNAYAIDKEMEDITNIQKANIDDMAGAVDQMAQFLAGASNIPLAKLFGKQQGGLNSTSQSDLENYVIFLKGMRFMVLEPSLKELDKFMRFFNTGLDIKFDWNPVASEQYIETNTVEAESADNE